jgi:hypothetical protein
MDPDMLYIVIVVNLQEKYNIGRFKKLWLANHI